MLTINFENEKAVLKITDRVDSMNAPILEKEIFETIDFESCKSILIDAEDLVMISSAGLRIILKMKKRCCDLRIIGVNSDVYEVFDMTGFTEMMKIEKAYRKLSVDGCEILGEGSNGIVYRYDPEIVIKVYRDSNAISEIERERRLARQALVLGIPTAIPFDVVKVGDKYGSVFELLDAQSFSKLISSEPSKTDEYLQMFIDLLKKIHNTSVDENCFDSVKSNALDWAKFLEPYLPAEAFNKLCSLIRNVPERKTMIHGDYHTNNVQMMNNEVLLIDMDTLSYGHPVFEFATMFLGFQGFGEIDHNVTLKFLKLPYDVTTYLWNKSLELYFNTSDEAVLNSVANKAKVIGYSRILRRTIKRIGFDNPEGKMMIEHYRKQLLDSLEKVDSLDF